MATLPISLSSEYFCVADEGSVAILASSSLRQVASISASSVVATFVDASNSLITVIDADGAVVSHHLDKTGSTRVETQFPYSLTDPTTANGGKISKGKSTI